MTPATGVAAIVLAPLLAAAVGLLTAGRSAVLARVLAVSGAVAALGLAVTTGRQVWGGPAATVDYATVPTGWVPVTLSLRSDGLGLTVAVMVATVALAVQVYSTSYLRRDPRYPTFAWLVSLFTAAMLLVVVADDLVVLLVGWEVMGLCSALLIGHHHELPEARAAALKAFVVTRLGDVGLLVGLLVLADLTGSFRLSAIDQAVASGALGSSGALDAGLVLVLAGVAGKSAQAPLHVWLPDAMAGPTPVSALIHAATMVAAGVFLVARLDGAYASSPAALAVLAVMASVTMLGAALAALAQDDIKRVLAWSTSSQLAYMLAGLAAGGSAAGLLHLLSHAAFKAMLFLAAGAVAHAVGSTLLADMGGLRRSMPLTAGVLALGLAGLAGVPPLAGFFSKDAVLVAAEEAALHGGPLPGWAAWTVLLAGLATVLITAAYVTRTWLLAAEGPSRVPAGSRPHDPGPVMAGPLLVLAVPTVLLGWAGLASELVSAAFAGGEPAAGSAATAPSALTAVASLVLTAAGGGFALVWWRRAGQSDPAAALGRARPAAAAGFGVDRLYDDLVVRPARAGARLAVAADRDVIGAYVAGTGALARAAGRAVNRTQSGRVQTYAAGVLAVAAALVTAGLVLG